jgi:OOP family OmpA-OmpF porin
MKKPGFLILICFVCLAGHAQNLVGNGSFEELSGKVKAGAGVDLATGWSSVTATSAELFSMESKDQTQKTPDNKYGREKPLSGINYAGFVAYSYQSKEPRSYLTTELVKPLVKGKKYCIRFNVSLSDLAKYAVNNIGINISKKQFTMDDSNESLLVEAQIMHSKNKVIDIQTFWEPVCGIYTAEGGERFLTIGNFYADKATDARKVKKPAQFKENQYAVAYYFVDDVSVELLDDEAGCECEKEEYVDVPKVVYQKQEDNVTKEELADDIINMKIVFDSLSADLKDDGLRQAAALAGYLKAKSDLRIVIVGHTSDVEADASKKNPTIATLSSRRAQMVADYLLKNGIPKTRIKIEGVKNLRPFVYGSTPEEQALNRAVNIELLGE